MRLLALRSLGSKRAWLYCCQHQHVMPRDRVIPMETTLYMLVPPCHSMARPKNRSQHQLLASRQTHLLQAHPSRCVFPIRLPCRKGFYQCATHPRMLVSQRQITAAGTVHVTKSIARTVVTKKGVKIVTPAGVRALCSEIPTPESKPYTGAGLLVRRKMSVCRSFY